MMLFQTLEQYTNREAVYADRSYSYKEMLEVGDSICQEVGKRSLVFCLCANRVESLFAYIGFLRGRVVPVLLDADIPVEQLQKLMERYQPTHVWAPETREDLAESLDSFYAYGGYALFENETSVRHQLHEELALLLTTSGSTGSPKLVRLTYKNLMANASSIIDYLDIDQTDKPITTLPMNYSYGLSIINSHLLKGATLILTDRSIVQKEFWELCRAEQATTFGGVPFHYEMLKRLKFETYDLPSLKKLTQAGGKLDSKLAQHFATVCAEKGIQFFIMYGQTEATARMSYLPDQMHAKKEGSIGIAIPGGTLTLRDESGNDIKDANVIGELVYQGDNVSFGYATSLADLSKGDDNQGVLRTGDMAYRDEDGYFFIVGRIKRMIKLYGSRISLDEVEALLREHGHDCVCAGEDDQLYVYTLQDDVARIQKIIKEQIKVKGVRVMQIDEIPRNAFGKIRYAALPKRELVTT
ncbi:AMP-binding protein [Exiguobacterium profundum]|uniref:AMP-binding protein n=1 Tax=Exiguobacterium profundum TaxID=307643 RepID=UPI0029C5CCD4|nr:AMP-binding protein [Exiguobacterium profundum]MDX5979676.1 AMP-binding protein [Exiguobacterium profundum]